MTDNEKDIRILYIIKFILMALSAITLGLVAVIFAGRHWDEKCKMQGGVPATFGGNSVCMTKDGRFMADPK